MSATADPIRTDADLISSLGALFDELSGSLLSDRRIPPAVWDAALLDPARDILSRSGKGFRGRLLERSWALAGGDPQGPPELLPVAIELLHVGSLVIDDIEDDSRMRRGKPALHRQYGLPLALNTGNWLYFLALALVSRVPVSDTLRLALYEDMSVALLRCHQGQALDLSVRVTAARRVDVPKLVDRATRLKTGSLMRLAALLGARAAGAPVERVEAIGTFGLELGVGLQMLDDWSGVGTRRDKGMEDVRLARPTWPWAWLAEAGDELAYADTVRQARHLSLDWEAAQVLDHLRIQLAQRAPHEIRVQLDRALTELRAALGDSAPLGAIRDDVEALERAFG